MRGYSASAAHPATLAACRHLIWWAWLSVTPFSSFARGRPWVWGLVGAYAAALLVSKALHDPEAAPSAPAGTTLVTVPAVEGIRRAGAPVRLAVRDLRPRGASHRTPLVLVHGSPGSGDVFRGLTNRLGTDRRLLVPDLPGFGASSTRIPDYSFRSHARYLLELLDRLGVERAHLLGFSMGGGVVVQMAAQEPSRVASIVMVSAIGVQEMELLGQYHLNHAVHALQLGAVWGLRTLAPPGESFDTAWSYARNFYDSDQRPLRAALRAVVMPMLIVHGRHDAQVPVEAAVEHARLVPQAQLMLVDTDHFMTFQDPGRLVPGVRSFLDQVDAGAAPTRAQAQPGRLRRAAARFDAGLVPRATGVTAVVLGALLAVASAALGGWAVAGAGVLVAQGRAGLGLALAAVAIGTAMAQRYRFSSRATIRAVARAAAGTAAAATAAPPLLDALQGWSAWAQAVLVIVLIAPAAWLLTMAASHRGRRLLLSSWRRLTRWEFWPIWAAYLPVAAYIVWLMVKHRGVTLVTAANPAIPGGGIVGESKFAILRGLAGSPANVAASALLEGDWPPGVKLARTEAFMRGHGLSLPVVLKPDAGQRGSGVVVIRTHDALVAALGAATVDTVVQEFVGGEEFGVFYCRRPSEPRGRILSITRKQLPTVRGDGVRSLERLILDDERAVCMARFHLREQQSRLAELPPRGEIVSLGDCGSHCRGAIFLDGSALRSEALEAAVERVAAAFQGFYFGRFDLRAPSAGALRAGRDFKILELNGVTSEPTHIYDPAVPVREAYRALFEQWRLAFAIGAENVARGAGKTSLFELARLAWRSRREARRHLTARAVIPTPARAGSRRPQSAPQPGNPA